MLVTIDEQFSQRPGGVSATPQAGFGGALTKRAHPTDEPSAHRLILDA
jgi:hypothetical protein